MKKFVVMAVANRLFHTCDSKACMRRGWLDRWYDYMFAVHGRERLEDHRKVLVEFYRELNAGRPARLRLSDLDICPYGMS